MLAQTAPGAAARRRTMRARRCAAPQTQRTRLPLHGRARHKILRLAVATNLCRGWAGLPAQTSWQADCCCSWAGVSLGPWLQVLDADAAKAEEQEALRLQREAAAQMRPEDYELGGDSSSEADDVEDEQDTLGAAAGQVTCNTF